jgi:PAS domain S-box-containing protein
LNSLADKKEMISTKYNCLSLKTKITIFMLVIFLISIWSLGFYASQMLYKDIKKLLVEQQFSTVSILAGQVNAELNQRVTALETISKTFSSTIRGDLAAMQTILEQRPIFQSLFNGGIMILNIDGTVVANVPIATERIGINLMERDSIAAALTEGKTSISRPVIGKKLYGPIFHISTPILDAQGKVIGALSGVTDLSKPGFLDKITDNRYGVTGSYLLISKKHMLFVTGTDKSYTMQPTPLPGENPLLDQYMQGFEGSGITTDVRGVEVLSSAKQIPASDWFIVCRLPTEEAFAPVRAMQVGIFKATLFMTLLVGGAVWWLLRRALSPLIVASESLTSIPDENWLPQPLPVTSRDEIGALIGSFNRLLEMLAQREKSLKESGKRHRTILETAMDGFWQADITGRLLEVNDTYCTMSGYSRRELLSMHIHDLEVANTRNDIRDHIENIMDQGEDRFESRHRHKDGSIYDVEVSVQFWPGGEGLLVIFVRDITTRKQADEALRTSLAEQEMLLKEVHHRVKNNLAAIMGLVDMQGQSLDLPAAGTALTELSARIKSMSLVHELLYQSEDFSRIDFQDYLEALVGHLRLSYGQQRDIRVAINAAGVEMGLDSAVPCGLFVTELITNAYKYAFPERGFRAGSLAGQITVTVGWDGVEYTISVADNGVGLPAGMDWTMTNTLGLLLVRMLGEHQLQGKIEIDNSEGTRFGLRFSPMGRNTMTRIGA